MFPIHSCSLSTHANGNAILLNCVLSARLLLHLCHFLWVSGIVSQLSTNFILAIASQSTLSILGLTVSWICPEDSATPAVLSNNFPFSHTPRQVGRVLVFSFLIIGNTQPTLPYALKIILSFNY